MQFFKNFFNHDNLVIGLCGLKKTSTLAQIKIPESYKKTFIQNTSNNLLLL